MPKNLMHHHIIGKVKSFKVIPETPPLEPVTFKKKDLDSKDKMTLQEFKASYKPHL